MLDLGFPKNRCNRLEVFTSVRASNVRLSKLFQSWPEVLPLIPLHTQRACIWYLKRPLYQQHCYAAILTRAHIFRGSPKVPPDTYTAIAIEGQPPNVRLFASVIISEGYSCLTTLTLTRLQIFKGNPEVPPGFSAHTSHMVRNSFCCAIIFSCFISL